MTKHWDFTPLGEVCRLVGGGTPSKRIPEYYSGDIPWATVRDMGDESLTSTEFRITQDAVANSSTNVIPAGNVIIATRVGLGKACILKQDTAINQDLRAVIPKTDQLDAKFLLYWFQHLAELIKSEGTGATVKGVKLPFIKSLLVPMPSLPEQKRIVALLDEAFAGIDTAIANTVKNITNAREVFEAPLNSIFRYSPDDWVEMRLQEICTIKHGFAFKSQYFSKDDRYILLTPGSFKEKGGFRDQGEKTKYYSGEIPSEYILDKGDFLIAMTEQAAGLLGSSLVIPESDRYLHNQRLGLVQPLQKVEWHNDFFFHQFNTTAFRAAVDATASGVKVRHTSPKKLGEITVKVPPTSAEQKHVADKLNELYSQTGHLHHLYEIKLIALNEFKQSLLQKAFLGELAARDAEREVQEATA